MNNALRWFLIVIISFATGAITAFTDPGTPTLVDCVRHGCITLLPALAGLKMTLEGKKANGNG